MIHLQLIKAHARRSPYRAAVVAKGSCLTWQEFYDETQQVTKFLLSCFGNNLPSQVCYISPNRPELIPWLAAFATLGIAVTGLDYTLPVAALKQLLEMIAADIVLVSTAQLKWEMEEWSALRTPVIDLDSPDIVYSLSQPEITTDVLSYLEEAPLPNKPYRAVGLTSGTTGMPKLVIRAEPFDQRRFAYFSQRYHFDYDDRFLVSMPLYHAAGNGWARMFLSLGATLYLIGIDEPRELMNAIEQEDVTATVMTPTLLRLVLDAANPNRESQQYALRWVLIGGKHFPAQQKKRALEQLGPVIYEYYGTTETGVNTIAEPPDLESHPHSVGRSFDGNAIAIVDSAGNRLGTGKIGIVAVYSYMNMKNYDDYSAKELFLEGKRYLFTSDQGYLDEEGRLYLMNRSFSRNNHHYHLYRLEDAIRSMPCVVDVALMQCEDRSNWLIDCAIEVKPQGSKTLHLQKHIDRLAATESLQLQRYRVVSRIPYSPSGKVKHGDLELLLSGS